MAFIKKSRIVGTIALLFIVLYFCPFIYGKVIYVDDDAFGANNGSSWENTYMYLQDALADASDSDKSVEIRVAQGIYKPDLGAGNVPGDREASFRLINDVTISGGYAGINANDPNARDIELYETTLSGDLNGDDVEDPNRAENSYHVLIGSGTNVTAVLDGFIVAGGAANGPELDSDPVYMDRLRVGGGMYNWKGSPTLKNCSFNDNTAEGAGGIYNYKGDPTLIKCTFSDNSAIGSGGMHNQEGSPILSNCSFNDNAAMAGGGMGTYKGSPILTNCTFSDNWGWDGGGMFNQESSPALTNCIFSGNSDGGMWIQRGSAILTNCTFSGNWGAIYHYNSDDPNSSLILTNCIIWHNAPNTIPQTSTIMYSNIQGGWEGEGNIDEDPLFVNPGYWADKNDPYIVVAANDSNAIWIDGDYHLKSSAGRWDPNSQSWVFDDVTSPCIDAGDPFSPVMYEPHPRGCIINMGAYGGTEEASKSPFGCSYEADSD